MKDECLTGPRARRTSKRETNMNKHRLFLSVYLNVAYSVFICGQGQNCTDIELKNKYLPICDKLIQTYNLYLSVARILGSITQTIGSVH